MVKLPQCPREKWKEAAAAAAAASASILAVEASAVRLVKVVHAP